MFGILCKMLQCKTKYKCLKDDLIYSGTFPAAFEATTSGDINDNLNGTQRYFCSIQW